MRKWIIAVLLAAGCNGGGLTVTQDGAEITDGERDSDATLDGGSSITVGPYPDAGKRPCCIATDAGRD